MRRVLLLGALSLVLGGASAAESWVEVKTANFTLVSNAGEGTARQTVWEFEQVRAAYARLWPWAKLAEGRPAMVLALKDEATLKRWAPKYYEIKGGMDIASVSAHAPDREYLLLRTDTRSTQSDVAPNYTLNRTFLSALLATSFERRLPLWLSNGLSAVFGNTSVRDKEVHLGRPVSWHVERFNRRGRHALRAILEAQADSPLVTREGEREMFDAQCWALVHYLSFADEGAHVPQLNRFIALWQAGKPHEQALSEALGDVAALEKQLPLYMTRPTVGFGRLLADVNVDRQKLPVRPVSLAEMFGLQAAVHVAMGRPAEAQAAIQQARSADALAPGSYDAAGLLADLQNERDKAALAYARAGELGSTSAYSYYRAAQLGFKRDADAATLGANRKLLERAIALNDKYAAAHAYLAEVMVEQDAGPAALPSAQRAVALEPGGSYPHVALARVLHKLGQAGLARSSAERGLQLASSDWERSNAQGFLDFLVKQAAWEKRRSEQEAARGQSEACQAGDAAACVQFLALLERDCAAGLASSCNYAGWFYTQGHGVEKDPAKAAAFIERGCAAGDKPACAQHAWLVARGEGVAKDEAKGLAALDALCGDKVFAACTRLAGLHAARPGAKDRARARELLAQACDGGEQDACSLAKTLK